jgi:hypothetical protein
VDGEKEMTKGKKPLGFKVRERGGYVGEEGNASAGRILRP